MEIPTIYRRSLTLRPFNTDDVGDLHQILLGEDVLRYFPNSSPPTRALVERMISGMLKHWDENGYGLWAIESIPDGELLGRCGLQYLPETDEIEVDFILSRQFWGQGFATEAGQASLQYGFEELDSDIIVGIVHEENSASQRVLEKIGMQFTESKEYFGMACYRYAIERS